MCNEADNLIAFGADQFAYNYRGVKIEFVVWSRNQLGHYMEIIEKKCERNLI